MKRLFAITVTLIVLTCACGSRYPAAETFAEVSQTGAMVALSNGGIRYGERLTGTVWEVDKSGARNPAKLGHVDVSNGGQRGLLGLAIDDQDRTFAAWTAPDATLLVGQVSPGPVRVIWTGPKTSDVNIGGRIVFTPTKRLLVALGDLQDHTKISDTNALNGKIITLDPDRGTDQTPNIISQGWTNPLGVTYMNELLWIADSGFKGEDLLGRAGADHFTGSPVSLGSDTLPWGLTTFGDKELVVCMRNTKILKRFLVRDVEAISGRSVASDCTRGVVELHDGRLAYANEVSIRVTD